MRQGFTSFLNFLGGESFSFRLLPDDPRSELQPRKFTLSLSDVMEEEVFLRLTLRNKEGYGVFVVVNEGGQDAKKIHTVRANFVDSDGIITLHDFDQNATIKPHLVVETSLNRFHAYWKTDCDVTRFTRTQEMLANFFHTDTSVTDLPRLMRVPGFINSKHPLPHLVQIVRYTTAAHTTVDLLRNAYGSSSTVIEDANQERHSNLHKLRTEGFNKGQRNKGMFSYAVYLFGKALSFQEVLSLVESMNKEKCTPPLEGKEIKQVVTSAQKTIIADQALKAFADAESIEDLVSITDEYELHIPEQTVKDIAHATMAETEMPSLDLPPNCIVTRVYDYLIATSFETTHELALAGALSYVGAIKGHTCRTYTNARSNLFILALAPSGTGKTEIKNRLFALSSAAGLKNFNIANPASEAGMLDALSINKRRFVAWDEFGLRLATITKSRNASSYESGIVTFLMEAFSAAGSVFYDRTRRVDAHKKRGTEAKSEIEIPYPHLSVFSISTPETFFKAVTLDQIDDGFIPRFIPVFSPPTIPQKLWRQVANKVDMRHWQSLAREIEGLYSMGTFPTEDDAFIPGEDVPVKMFADDAFELWANFQYNCRTRRNDRFTPIWLRAAEHAMKIALTICDNDTIGIHHTEWAIHFVTKSIEHFLGKSYSTVADNEESVLYLKLLAFIGKYDETGCLRRDIVSRFSRNRAFKDCLQSAIDSGAVEKFYKANNGKNKRGEWYRLSPLGREKAVEYMKTNAMAAPVVQVTEDDEREPTEPIDTQDPWGMMNQDIPF